MKTRIFYFTATGNCLSTARELMTHLPKSQLSSFSSYKDDDIITIEEERIGFVFPIYYGDMPYLVRNVISKMNFKENAYIFAFVTCRGHPGDINRRLHDLLKTRGQQLSLGLHIAMPGNS